MKITSKQGCRASTSKCIPYPVWRGVRPLSYLVNLSCQHTILTSISSNVCQDRCLAHNNKGRKQKFVMVFRGKPSKACERCRVRRLRCDLNAEGCGQCARAKTLCAGYRDTQQLRVRNESRDVAKKVLKHATRPEPRTLALSVDTQARDAFFVCWVESKCWEFLEPYHHPLDSPEHLTLAIEAVSLAYLWHQAYSDIALAAARERYGLALRTTNRSLLCPKEATKGTTLLTALLLDLFEKLTSCQPQQSDTWARHVSGALSLIKLRGLQHFQDSADLEILVRLCMNCILSCIANNSPVPDQLNAVHAYVWKHVDTQDCGLRLSDLIFEYANLRSDTRWGVLSVQESIKRATVIDLRLQVLDCNLPVRWQYSTMTLNHKSEWALDLYYHFYPNPKVCLARNQLRVIRILLNEMLLDHYLSEPPDNRVADLITAAHEKIRLIAHQICACTPQYVDCNGIARRGLSFLKSSSYTEHIFGQDLTANTYGIGHTHTHDHVLNCYTLIFPLFVAARSEASPGLKHWIIKQLHHIAEHFHVRNAKVVAQILEQDVDVGPWEVFAMLGSYALAL